MGCASWHSPRPSRRQQRVRRRRRRRRRRRLVSWLLCRRADLTLLSPTIASWLLAGHALSWWRRWRLCRPGATKPRRIHTLLTADSTDVSAAAATAAGHRVSPTSTRPRSRSAQPSTPEQDEIWWDDVVIAAAAITARPKCFCLILQTQSLLIYLAHWSPLLPAFAMCTALFRQHCASPLPLILRPWMVCDDPAVVK